MPTRQFCRYLREAPGEHTYLPKKTGTSLIKIIRNYDVFVLQKQGCGRYLQGKKV